jgi:phosphatidylserine/phosphatidylglycerophosphate/cardiolipin synthase-like enzyme
MKFLLALLATGSLYAAAPQIGQFDTQSSVLVTRDAAETTRWKLELIRNAQQSIELSANFAGGPEFREALRLMGEALERNPKLQVHFLYDRILMDPEDKALTEQLALKYPERFHPVMDAIEIELVESGASVGNHMKILVIDEKYFIVGGTNFEQTLSTEGLRPEIEQLRDNAIGSLQYAGSRDMDVVGIGPLAETLRRVYFVAHARFEQLVLTGRLEQEDAPLAPYSRYYSIDSSRVAQIPALDQHPELIRDAPVKLTIGGPHYPAGNPITHEYVRLVQGAQHSIRVGNLYLMPPRDLFQSFLDAGNRGVAMTFITNGVHDRSPSMTQFFAWGGRLNYYPLLTGVELEGPDFPFADEIPPNDVRLFEYYVDRVAYHKKVMVVDDSVLVVGCYNLGKKSDRGDYELILTIASQAAARKAAEVLAVDQAHARPVTRDEATSYYFTPWYVALGKTQQLIGGFY